MFDFLFEILVKRLLFRLQTAWFFWSKKIFLPYKSYDTKSLFFYSKSSYWKYLEDSSITLFGIKIYGSPWQPNYFNWAFNLPRGKLLKQKWDKIPNCHILLTHGPPYCHGDKLVKENKHIGCEDLLKACTHHPIAIRKTAIRNRDPENVIHFPLKKDLI